MLDCDAPSAAFIACFYESMIGDTEIEVRRACSSIAVCRSKSCLS